MKCESCGGKDYHKLTCSHNPDKQTIIPLTMSDITKCSGADCDLKSTCYRYTAATGMYQSFFIGTPLKDGECEYYWEQTSNLRNDCGLIAE